MTQNYDDLTELDGCGAGTEELDAAIMAEDVKILKSRLKSMGRASWTPAPN